MPFVADSWERKDTGVTYAEKWAASDDDGKREMLKEMHITACWQEIDGKRYPSVTMVPLWALAE